MVGACAALVATASDLLLLYVVNSRRPELHLPAVPSLTLWLGGALGVVAIPFYACGYQGAARALAPRAPGAARIVRVAGVSVAVLGSLIHALTTTHLAADVEAGLPGRDPLEAIASWGPLLRGLWAIGSVLGVCASAAFAWAVGRGDTRLPSALAWANPVLLMLLLALIALPIPILRAFLTPAAPNLAHALFFAACAAALMSRRTVHDTVGASASP
jgi:hypothetical protein